MSGLLAQVTSSKATAHPLRIRILRAMAAKPRTPRSPNELARDLGEPLGNVSYHVRILRELDILELERTEQRRGALEHYYLAHLSKVRGLGIVRAQDEPSPEQIADLEALANELHDHGRIVRVELSSAEVRLSMKDGATLHVRRTGTHNTNGLEVEVTA